MDENFRTAPFACNFPLLLGLLAITSHGSLSGMGSDDSPQPVHSACE
jgi:hypothetical protein